MTDCLNYVLSSTPVYPLDSAEDVDRVPGMAEVLRRTLPLHLSNPDLYEDGREAPSLQDKEVATVSNSALSLDSCLTFGFMNSREGVTSKSTFCGHVRNRGGGGYRRPFRNSRR